jgi:hypothetical protein
VLALADAGRREVILLDRFGTLLGRRPWPLEGAGPTGMAFSGHLLLACGEGGLVLWRGGEELARWSAERFGGPVRDLAAQGGRVATVGDGGVFFFRLVLP